MTFCAPKSVSLLWAMGADSDVRDRPDTTRRTGSRNHQSVRSIIAWVIIWYFLTFLGVMIGSMNT
ncbi:hypothetical protein [Corynebacterium sp. HMSC05E07]|uniref:hypothetical protein n=1 Tax=Corynebacterium sp. HMSC05E07 TaxID=1581117 RepID=UPI00114D3609|nr:hypothetical protein [Corynebacterium sp. HMSC05E07]